MADHNDALKSKGALFMNNDRENAQQPNFRGYILLTKPQIKKLIEMDKAGVDMKVQVAGWKKLSAANEKYIFMSTEIYIPKKGKKDRDDDFDDNDFDDDDIPF